MAHSVNAAARLDGRHALVTGASRGIGRATALALAQAGAHLTLTYRTEAKACASLARDIEAAGARVCALPLDLAEPAQIAELFQTATRDLGPVDVLVNNAAMIDEQPFETLDLQAWDRMQAVNLRGPFLCAQHALPAMTEAGWGRIINMSSIGGQWGGTRQVHYACAKAGLIGLTRSLAKLGAPHGVTSNAIAPGLIATDMIADELASAAGREKLAAIPLGRVGTCDEVAAAVLYLASDSGAYITGQTLNLNGGMLFQ